MRASPVERHGHCGLVAGAGFSWSMAPRRCARKWARTARFVSAAGGLAVAAVVAFHGGSGFSGPSAGPAARNANGHAQLEASLPQAAQAPPRVQATAAAAAVAFAGAAVALTHTKCGNAKRSSSPVTRAYTPPTGPPVTETVEMKETFDGKIGVAVMGGRRTVSRLSHPGAFTVGWRVGDTVTEVNGKPVVTNEELKEAVKEALAKHNEDGTPMTFTVRRRKTAIENTQSMLRMTPGNGGALSVPMSTLVRGLILEFPVVVFLDGTIKVPGNNLSARAVEALQETGLAFKAVDCGDEKYNPGVKAAVEDLAGEFVLPQLWVGGNHIGNGYKIEELQKAGELKFKLMEIGAMPVDS